MNGKCEVTIDSHSDTTNALIQLKDGNLCSGSNDTLIKIWNLKGKLKKTFKGHEGWIVSLVELKGGKRIASSSYDGTVKIWNLKGECKRSFHHGAKLREIVQLEDERIASLCEDRIVRVWSLKGKCLQKINLDNIQYEAIVLKNGRFMTAGDKGSIFIFKSKKIEKENSIKEDLKEDLKEEDVNEDLKDDLNEDLNNNDE
jgi:WD40 repeat protein